MNRHERRAQGKSTPPPKVDPTQKPILDDNDTRALAQIVVDILHGRKKVILETSRDIMQDGNIGTFKIVPTEHTEPTTGDTNAGSE